MDPNIRKTHDLILNIHAKYNSKFIQLVKFNDTQQYVSRKTASHLEQHGVVRYSLESLAFGSSLKVIRDLLISQPQFYLVLYFLSLQPEMLVDYL